MKVDSNSGATVPLSPSYLESLLKYEPSTGKLFWRERPESLFKRGCYAGRWNKKYANTEAFTAVDGEGYKSGGISNKTYRAHRLIAVMIFGRIPDDKMVDHINGVRSDNRECNLRLVDRKDNTKNGGRRSNNTSGVNGVYFQKQRGLWVAQINVGGKTLNLGRFDTIEEASEARKQADVAYSYHENHGSVREFY